MLASEEVGTALSPMNGNATFSLQIGNNPWWLGLSLFHQVVAVDPTANALQLVVSNGVSTQFGQL